MAAPALVLPLPLVLERAQEPAARSLAVLDTRARGTSFHAIAARAVLNPPAATMMPFWSLNPYIGCEFGCGYCYARETHRWTVERARDRGDLAGDALAAFTVLPPPVAFERRILVKADAAAVLARTLDPRRVGNATIVIGTATDPYQPAERRFRLTRALLEAFLPLRGLALSITTKSPLVARDRALLARLAERHRVGVNISVASLDAALLRRLEPRTPVPAARLRALRQLRDAGVSAGVLVAPILPRLTDGTAALRALLEAAAEAGALWAHGHALRLGAAARAQWLPLVEREFPALAGAYRRHYARGASASRAYRERLGARFRALRAAAGIPARHEAAGWEPAPPAPPVQGALFGDRC